MLEPQDDEENEADSKVPLNATDCGIFNSPPAAPPGHKRKHGFNRPELVFGAAIKRLGQLPVRVENRYGSRKHPEPGASTGSIDQWKI